MVDHFDGDGAADLARQFDDVRVRVYRRRAPSTTGALNAELDDSSRLDAYRSAAAQ
ncbi:MAG TPA: hypothetical protein VJR89_07170 [Polyangiales bacterium]|nr:hypothetical protein [Polyangiales bacterium]